MNIYALYKLERMMFVDNVNNPKHYNMGEVETIEKIKCMTEKHYKGYLIGNIIKYLDRYEYKNGVEDLKKAGWYLEELIKEFKSEKDSQSGV